MDLIHKKTRAFMWFKQKLIEDMPLSGLYTYKFHLSKYFTYINPLKDLLSMGVRITEELLYLFVSWLS